MIADQRVFDDAFVPPDLLHRENEIDRLLRRFTARDERDVLISGPSGVGKTVLARKAVDQLVAEKDVQWVLVDSLGKTTAGVLRTTLEALPTTPDEISRTTPLEECRRQLREAVDRETIVVLDEGDDLPETDAIGELLAMANVAVVAIAHNATDWLSRLDVDEAHPLEGCHVELGRYSVNELADILERRARQGFHGDVVDRRQLEQIADEVAGVARNGIQALYAAAELANERGHLTIHDDDVDDGYERARHRIRKLNLTSLPFHHQVLYAIVHEAGELRAEELHARYVECESIYENKAPMPISERQRRRKFPKLVDYDLVEFDGTNRGRVYRAVDEDVEPTIELPEPSVTRS